MDRVRTSWNRALYRNRRKSGTPIPMSRKQALDCGQLKKGGFLSVFRWHPCVLLGFHDHLDCPIFSLVKGIECLFIFLKGETMRDDLVPFQNPLFKEANDVL